MRLSFLGGGNMAEALLGGVIDRRVVLPQHVQVVDPNPDRRRTLEQRFGVTALPVIDDGFFETDLVVLAVKPQVAPEAVPPLAGRLRRAVVLSIMAGVPIARLQAWLGESAPVVRAMPNTPALVGAGITGVYAPPNVEAHARAQIDKLLASVGEVLWVDAEPLIDAVTAISGSGPAYVFLFLEALERAATAQGFSVAAARRLALATLSGAAKLAEASVEPFEVLRQRVTSPGGTTAAALKVLEERAWADALTAAVAAARRRAEELAAGG